MNMKRPTKPIPPDIVNETRCETNRFLTGIIYDSIQSIINQLPDGYDLKKTELQLEEDCYGGGYYIQLLYRELETNKEYAARQKKEKRLSMKYASDLLRYKEKLKAYNAWRKKNKVKLDQIAQLQKEIKEL